MFMIVFLLISFFVSAQAQIQQTSLSSYGSFTTSSAVLPVMHRDLELNLYGFHKGVDFHYHVSNLVMYDNEHPVCLFNYPTTILRTNDGDPVAEISLLTYKGTISTKHIVAEVCQDHKTIATVWFSFDRNTMSIKDNQGTTRAHVTLHTHNFENINSLECYLDNNEHEQNSDDILSNPLYVCAIVATSFEYIRLENQYSNTTLLPLLAAAGMGALASFTATICYLAHVA